MATISRRGDGQWQAKVRKKGWPEQSKTFEIRKGAEEWAREIERDMDRGAFMPTTDAEQTTIDDVLAEYLREVTPTKKNWKSESEIIGRLRARFGRFSLIALHAREVAAFRDELLTAGRAASTVKHYLDTLAVVIRYAEREMHIHLPAGNPVDKVKRPSQPAGRERRLMHGELRRLLRECRRYRNPVLQPLILLALETAARQGELFDLQWPDVDLGRSVMTLRDTKNTETRGVPLSPAAVVILRGLLPEAENVRQLPIGKVFRGSAAATRVAFIRAMARARARYEQVCERAGREPDPRYLADLRFHDLRHEAISRLFESGRFEMMEIASISGHKTMAMLRRYTHLHADRLAKKMAGDVQILRPAENRVG